MIPSSRYAAAKLGGHPIGLQEEAVTAETNPGNRRPPLLDIVDQERDPRSARTTLEADHGADVCFLSRPGANDGRIRTIVLF